MVIIVGTYCFLLSILPSKEDISTPPGSFEIIPLPSYSHAWCRRSSHTWAHPLSTFDWSRGWANGPFPGIFGLGKEGLMLSTLTLGNIWKAWELSFAIYRTRWTWEIKQGWEWRIPSLKREKKSREINQIQKKGANIIDQGPLYQCYSSFWFWLLIRYKHISISCNHKTIYNKLSFG